MLESKVFEALNYDHGEADKTESHDLGVKHDPFSASEAAENSNQPNKVFSLEDFFNSEDQSLEKMIFILRIEHDQEISDEEDGSKIPIDSKDS